MMYYLQSKTHSHVMTTAVTNITEMIVIKRVDHSPIKEFHVRS